MDPVVEAKDLFWSLTRKATKASKSALTKVKKTVGIPTGQISEANPRYYMVLARQGAVVRRNIELESPEEFKLHFGDVITCVEISGRRARIIDPIEGWVSLTTANDEVIMEPTFPPSKECQVRAMNRRFDKLKQQQSGQRSLSPPVATPVVQRSVDAKSTTSVADPDAVSSSNTASLDTLKSKIVFKSSSTSNTKQAIPVLSMDIPRPPRPVNSNVSAQAPEIDLLGLSSPSVVPQPQVIQNKAQTSTSGFSLI